MHKRSNQEWVSALKTTGSEREHALKDLRDGIFQALFAYLSKEVARHSSIDREETRQIAEDCTQETILAVSRHLNDFRGDSQFTTWVYTIAVRQSLAQLRRRQWYRLKQAEPSAISMPHPAWPGEQARAPGPERAFQREQAWQILAKAIENDLTLRQRSALVAHALNGMPLDLVAEWLNTNRDNVYKLIHDARKRLKQSLVARGLSHSEMLKIFADDGPGS